VLLGIDHLVIAVADPQEAAGELERKLGLRATGGGRHDAFGTFNVLVWLGDSYLELVGVFDRDLAERSWLGRPTLAALERGGGLATFALASDALGSDVAELRDGGSRLAAPIAGERRRGDGRTVRWQVSLPPELGRDEPPFLIEHDLTAAEWTPEDRAGRAQEVHPVGHRIGLASVAIPATSVAALASSCVRDLGLSFRPSLAGGGARDASVGRQIVRLRPVQALGSGAWPGAVIRLEGKATERREAEALGCRWIVNPV
jgi:hypothetical protein